MHQPGWNEPAVEQSSQALPGDSFALAAPSQDVPPVAFDPPKATANSTYSQTYTYDPYGNMDCAANPAEPKCIAPTYSATRNQISGYGYDLAGNLTNGLAQTPAFWGLRCPEGTGSSGLLNPAGPYAEPTCLADNKTASSTKATPQAISPSPSSRGSGAAREVLGHQHPADEQAVDLLPDFFEAFGEAVAKKG
jgi:hypothetical protein